MNRDELKIGLLGTAIGTLAGGYAESCNEGECWTPTQYQAGPDCQEAPLPPSCVAKEVGQALADIPAPALEYPQGAAIGTVAGLFGSMLLVALGRKLDRNR